MGKVRVGPSLFLSAGWQSGHAAACKAVDAGSIPTPASKAQAGPRPGGETGRRKGLKIPRPQGRAGSSPAPGTILRKNEKALRQSFELESDRLGLDSVLGR